MNIGSHHVPLGFIFAGILMGLWSWSQKRRAKENAKTSAILRKRQP